MYVYLLSFRNIQSQVKLWIRQSLEQASDRCETRQRFNLLIEDRRKLTEQLGQFTYADADEKAQLEADIHKLNECISQLQREELTEGINDMQAQACWNQLRNINECRVAIRFMFRQLVQERVNHVMAESELQQVRLLNCSLEQVNCTLHNELEQIKSENSKQLKRSIAVRRTSMLLPSNNKENAKDGHGPPSKKQVKRFLF